MRLCPSNIYIWTTTQSRMSSSTPKSVAQYSCPRLMEHVLWWWRWRIEDVPPSGLQELHLNRTCDLYLPHNRASQIPTYLLNFLLNLLQHALFTLLAKGSLAFLQLPFLLLRRLCTRNILTILQFIFMHCPPSVQSNTFTRMCGYDHEYLLVSLQTAPPARVLVDIHRSTWKKDMDIPRCEVSAAYNTHFTSRASLMALNDFVASRFSRASMTLTIFSRSKRNQIGDRKSREQVHVVKQLSGGDEWCQVFLNVCDTVSKKDQDSGL